MLITLTSVVIGPSMERERIDAALKPESGLMTSGVCSATSWLILQKVLGQQEAEFKGKLGHIPIPVSLRLNTDIKPVHRRQTTPAVCVVESGGPLAGQVGSPDRDDEGSARKRLRDMAVLVVIPTQSGVRICEGYRQTANPQLEPLKHVR